MTNFDAALGAMGNCCRFFVYQLTFNAGRGKWDKKPIGSPVRAAMTFTQV